MINPVLYWLCDTINSNQARKSQVITLLIPHYQGRVLDDIAQKRGDNFARDILIFLGFNFASGLSGSLQSLSAPTSIQLLQPT